MKIGPIAAERWLDPRAYLRVFKNAIRPLEIKIAEKVDGRRIKRFLPLRNLRDLTNEHIARLGPYYREYTSGVSDEGNTISLELAGLLSVLCAALKPKRIVDFGSGFSSFVFRFYRKNAVPPPEVWSVDDSAEWLTKTKAFLAKHLVDEERMAEWPAFIKGNHPQFDFMLIDLSTMEIRMKLLEDMISTAAPDGIIVLDDLHKAGYPEFVKRCLKRRRLKYYSLRMFTKDRQGRFSWLAGRDL